MPKRSHRYRRLVAALAAVVVPRASALCTGIAHESKACRRPRESNTRTVLPLPADDATDNMTDLELVLKQYGMSGLRLLNVSYAGAGGAKLRGAGTRVDNGHAAWVGAEPDIQWNCDCIAMVLMVDPDCGGRRSTAPEQTGWCGPALHAMWHDCTGGNLRSCKVRLPYSPPGVSDVTTNRYAFLLLKQRAPLNLGSLPTRSERPKTVAYYDLARLIESNALQPLAWNFMHVTGNGLPAWKTAVRRSAATPSSRSLLPVAGTSKLMPADGLGGTMKNIRAAAEAYLRAGGRHLDTAQMYLNYDHLREAIKRSGVPRDEIWITSKVNTDKKYAGDTRRPSTTTAAGALTATKEANSALGIAQIDLMLIHVPWLSTEGERVAVWRGLIEAQKARLVRAIGVSNYNQTQIEGLEAATGVRPAVLQMELHPWIDHESKALVKWCAANKIAVIAYNSLGGRRSRARSAAVSAVGRKHGKTNAQVLLRWARDQGVAVIPGASSAKHIAENLQLDDFKLSSEERAAIEGSRRPGTFQMHYALGAHLVDVVHAG